MCLPCHSFAAYIINAIVAPGPFAFGAFSHDFGASKELRLVPRRGRKQDLSAPRLQQRFAVPYSGPIHLVAICGDTIYICIYTLYMYGFSHFSQEWYQHNKLIRKHIENSLYGNPVSAVCRHLSEVGLWGPSTLSFGFG